MVSLTTSDAVSLTLWSHSFIAGMESTELGDSQKKEYNSHVLTAKALCGRQEHHEALAHYRKAYHLFPNSKLESKISKLMVCIWQERRQRSTADRYLCEFSFDCLRKCLTLNTAQVVTMPN